jgi:hypothetical protein
MVVDTLLEHGAKFIDNTSGFSPIDYARKDKQFWNVCTSYSLFRSYIVASFCESRTCSLFSGCAHSILGAHNWYKGPKLGQDTDGDGDQCQ